MYIHIHVNVHIFVQTLFLCSFFGNVFQQGKVHEEVK